MNQALHADLASRHRLAHLAGRRLHALSLALRRSQAVAEAAALSKRLSELQQSLAPGTLLTGSQYLRLRRELSALEQEQALAEAALSRTRRQARAELTQVAELLHELLPDRAPALSGLLLDVPVDPGMPARLQSLLALIETRRQVVPRLMAARQQWKK